MRRLRMLLLLAATLALASGQDAGLGGGSSAGSAGGGGAATGLPTTKPPTSAPTTTSPAPTPTTEAPTDTPTPTTSEPTTAAPTTATPTATPTTTPTPNVTDASTTTPAPTPAPEATLESASVPSAATTPSTPAPTPKGASYGTRSGSDGSQPSETTTKSEAEGTKTAVQFVAVAAGVLAVVAAVAMSVHFHQKRRALAEETEDDKFFDSGPKRPTLIAVPTTSTAVAAPVASASNYDNFTTPQAADPAWLRKTATANANAMATQPAASKMAAPMALGAFRDSDVPASSASTAPLQESGIVTTAATTGFSATFVGRHAGENDVTGDDEYATDAAPAYVEEDFRSPRAAPRVTVNRITKCRGKSEDSTVDGHGLSEFGSGLLSSTFDSEPLEYHNSQMFAFSDSGSEGDRDSARQTTGNDANVPEFAKYYADPAGAAHVDVDVDVDTDGYDDEEEIMGRDTRSSSMSSDIGHNRVSVASSIGEFHDSTVDRPSELDEEEFEV